MARSIREEKDTLLILTAGPVVWAAHFLLSYGTVAIYCAKTPGQDVPLAGARVAIAVYTAVALALISVVAYLGVRRHRLQDSNAMTARDSEKSRHRFLGFATLLLAGLSAIAVVYAALAAVFIGTCR